MGPWKSHLQIRALCPCCCWSSRQDGGELPSSHTTLCKSLLFITMKNSHSHFQWHEQIYNKQVFYNTIHSSSHFPWQQASIFFTSEFSFLNSRELKRKQQYYIFSHCLNHSNPEYIARYHQMQDIMLALTSMVPNWQLSWHKLVAEIKLFINLNAERLSKSKQVFSSTPQQDNRKLLSTSSDMF